MSILVLSNHTRTRIGAWVNKKMSGRNPLVSCTIPLIAMQGYHTQTDDTGSLDYNSISQLPMFHSSSPSSSSGPSKSCTSLHRCRFPPPPLEDKGNNLASIDIDSSFPFSAATVMK